VKSAPLPSLRLDAILRAAYLANPRTENSGPTLLLTFNKALVAYLRHIGGSELRGLTVENYHKFGRGYLEALRDVQAHLRSCAKLMRKRTAIKIV